jgi:heme-degrading monooxygenase HmoA
LIIRILRGRVQPVRQAAFRAQARQALADARGRDGFVSAHVGRQVHGDGTEEVLFVSLWRDLESLYRWVGSTDLLETPVLSRGLPDVFETYEVQHYEVWDDADKAEFASPRSAVIGSAATP